MYIYEIIIDGFKSYAQRTVVSGFDPQFNAITGLNGTGKSNILDSICFVLGISNLSQVRVGNLQELVYKQGQAGVTKATVTIVFDNSDPTTSPVAYESCKQITVTRQVVIGGKNKYMINGRTVQQNEVQNLFHSVQLNVNNPHFLIMQGRITKVLNMKPMEILGMIEEAAGTRMFETKKQAALKTIEKKQLKVDDLTKCMSQEITPTLESLRTERQQYQQWITNNTEIEKLERACVAYDYWQADEKIKSADKDRQIIVGELTGYQALESSMETESKQIAARIEEIQKSRENESEGPLVEMKKTENELSKDLVKISTLLNNQSDTLQNERDGASAISSQIEILKTSIAKKATELEKCQTDLKLKEREAETAEQQAVTLRDKYQNACAGVADETSAAMLSLPEQVATWEKRAREAESQLQQGVIRADHAKAALKELIKTRDAQQTAQDKTLKQRDASRAQISDLEKKLAEVGYDEIDENRLRQESSALKSQVASLKDEVNTLMAQTQARMQFHYKDPEKGFDRSRVKGYVAQLIRVSDPSTAAALEVVAGAKLYSVVVDNESTAQLILKKGSLSKRFTLLPLNKIDNRIIDRSKLEAAKNIARSRGCSAHLALELVTCEDSVRRAVEHVFGNTIICDDADVARAIAFAPNVRTRTITLEGDVYDPSGTLTGGSMSILGTLLSKLASLASAREKLAEAEERLTTLNKQLKDCMNAGALARDITESLELQRQSLNICDDKITDSNYAQTVAEIENLQSQLEKIEKESKSLMEAHKGAQTELAKLRLAESGAKSQRELAMKSMEAQVRSAQKTASGLRAECASLRTRADTLVAEVKALHSEQSALTEQLSICNQGVSRLDAEIERLTREVNTCRDQYEMTKKALVNKQAELNGLSKEIKTLSLAKDKCNKAAQTASLEARKVSHRLKQWEGESKNAAKRLTVMLKQHPWIEKEKQFFGVAGSDFEFCSSTSNSNVDAVDKDVIGDSQKRLAQLKLDQEKLVKKVNKKVMGMIEKAESEYRDLSQKREVIEKDKAKIEAVIEELDLKKTQALQTTWTKVNRDFGSIFSMLLPGTQAKLEPPEGLTASDGLEVKVAFNGVWKESLTELSGGQRSLLALSLILGLLLFKPAPMYILDEVDAALDLSHTQNIGLMLRTHFSTSQFIVVSLKEGMFNNANVIFRTRFVDGVSTVSRTVVSGKNRPQAISKENEEEEEEAPKRKRAPKAIAAESTTAVTKRRGEIQA